MVFDLYLSVSKTAIELIAMGIVICAVASMVKETLIDTIEEDIPEINPSAG